MKTLTTVIASICIATLAWSSASTAQNATARKPSGPTVVNVTGEASTNSLSAETTLGSAELRLQGKGVKTIRLSCGILGQVLGANPDGSLNIQHTIACDDHSLFIVSTHTVITPDPTRSCAPRPGFVGTFHEESRLQGVDGPLAGATGELTLEGTINCGFNDMQIKGTATLP